MALIKLTFLLAFFGSALSLPNFYENSAGQSENGENRIQTGKIVKEIPPFIVGIVYRGIGHFCTATLITPDRVLTAAHCFDKSDEGKTMQAVLGLENIQPANIFFQQMFNKNFDAIDFVLEDVVKPQKYENVTAGNDIAIIKLKSTVKPIFKPITLATNEKDIQSPLKAMGWGMKTCNLSSSDALREADGQYHDNPSCAALRGQRIRGSKLCMTYTVDGEAAAVASGDSGGPVFSLADPENPIQVGILSYGSHDPNEEWDEEKPWKCIDKKIPQVYTRVASWKAFIQAHAPDAKFSS